MSKFTPQIHQSYIEARQRANMPYIENYNEWLTKNAELAELRAENEIDTWENSEYNPANYPDFNSFDDNTKKQLLIQGEQEYWRASEALETKISKLEHLLANSDEFEKADDTADDTDINDYWTTND